MAVADTIVAAAFAVWFLLSVGFQTSWFATKIGKFDKFGLLPRWTFFAPNPGRHDYHLVYRECGADVDLSSLERLEAAAPQLSPWIEVPDLHEGRSLLFLWHPQRRITKTMTDIVNGLLLARGRLTERPSLVQFTVEYFLLLHLIQRGASPAVKRQFAIVRTRGFESERERDIVFVSNFHRAAVQP